MDRSPARTPPATLRILLAGLLGVWFFSGGAHAADLAPMTFSPSGDLSPGQEVTVTWAPLPPDTEEFELLLRIEEPLAITLRLTECKDPALGSLSWRIPAVPCERAKLLLRHGRGGREALWAESPPFQIVHAPRMPTCAVTLRDGEYWLSGEAATQISADSPHAISGVPLARGYAAEGSGSSQGGTRRSAEGRPASPPPFPGPLPGRARCVSPREARPLQLRI